MSNKQLKGYLKNRRRLDLALKVVLGSEAFLHDISSFD